MGKRKSVQVLLFEDDRPARILLERELTEGGQVGVTVGEGQAVLDQLARGGYDVVLRDLELPKGSNARPLRLARGSGQNVESILLSRDVPDLAEMIPHALEEAHRFLTRPLKVAPSAPRAVGGNGQDGPRPLAGLPGASAIIGSSQPIYRLLQKVERIAASGASVLVQGETGTGKTLVARAIHEASMRRARPFVVVNCSAFQDQLLESELFGHEKGAFTGAVAAKQGLFEIAHEGTLFLDEVAEMSSAMQAKLLQVLDSGELRRVGGTRLHRVDVRVVSASNKELSAEVRAGRFREDLLFRLKVITLELPPLRERREDIPELVEFFLSRFRGPSGTRKSISNVALSLLSEYSWPGNVRELANVIEGLVLMTLGDEIGALDLPTNLRPSANFEPREATAPLPMDEIERLHILRALAYTDGRKAQAARLLDIDIKTLNSKIRSYGIVQ